MVGLEEVSFQIIAAVGTARSMYINAIQAAKAGKFDEAKQMMKEAEECFITGHKAHMEVLTMQANGDVMPFDLLLVHAEDQMMSAETLKIMADEMIQLYQNLADSTL